VSRVLVLWSRPYHLPAEQAERWAAEQVRELIKAAAVTRASLIRLGNASTRNLSDWDWLLELEVELSASSWIDDWIGDLRLLGSRPAVLLEAARIPLEGG
jgi:hypothetical protein